jgi:hypothetical protein
MDNLDYHNDKSAMVKNAISKVGNNFHATGYAERYKADGVVSFSLNPGMLDPDLYRHQSAIFGFSSEEWSFIRLFSAHTPSFLLESPPKSQLSDRVIGVSLLIPHERRFMY